MLHQWKITVPEGEKVRLTFTFFDLVPEVCGDFVEVYDGDKAGSSSFSKHDVLHDPSTQWGLEEEKMTFFCCAWMRFIGV